MSAPTPAADPQPTASAAATTGPKTVAGKAAVSQNARTHGILSTAPVLPGLEDELEWLQSRNALYDAFGPDGAFECALAERAASLFWRLRRVVRYETEMATVSRMRAKHDIVRRLPPQPDDPAEHPNPPAPRPTVADAIHETAGAHLLPPPDVLDRVMRYESHLHRQLTAVLHELEAAQTRRRGGHIPLARLDLSGLSNSIHHYPPLGHPGYRDLPPE
jgi:hypothetical protein